MSKGSRAMALGAHAPLPGCQECTVQCAPFSHSLYTSGPGVNITWISILKMVRRSPPPRTTWLSVTVSESVVEAAVVLGARARAAGGAACKKGVKGLG